MEPERRTEPRKPTFLAIICSTLVMGVGTLLFQLFPDRIVSIFGSESELYQEFAVKSLRIFLLLILLNGFQLCTGTFFQAVGKPVQATLISLSRQVLFLLPALLILPHFFGVEGALWAGPGGGRLRLCAGTGLWLSGMEKNGPIIQTTPSCFYGGLFL